MIPIMKKRADIKNQKYQKAIRLKYESFSYPEIAELLKVSEITVKRWFRPDGLLRDEYDAYEKEMNAMTDSVSIRSSKQKSRWRPRCWSPSWGARKMP